MDSEAVGLPRGAVVMRPHDPRWAHCFGIERSTLLTHLASRVLAIQHIGSTAVPGLAAKPIIDVQGVVRHLDDADILVTTLVELGYEYMATRAGATRIFLPEGPALKHELVHQHSGDRGAYTAAKSAFVNRVLANEFS